MSWMASTTYPPSNYRVFARCPRSPLWTSELPLRSGMALILQGQLQELREFWIEVGTARIHPIPRLNASCMGGPSWWLGVRGGGGWCTEQVYMYKTIRM
jgi:hypothetical protein